MKTWEEVLKSLEAEKIRLTNGFRDFQRFNKSAFASCGNRIDIKELADAEAYLPKRIEDLEIMISLVQERFLDEPQIEQCIKAIASQMVHLRGRVEEIEMEIIKLGRERRLYEDMARIAGIFSFRS